MLRITAREAWCLDLVIQRALEDPDVFGSESVERNVFFAQLIRIQKQLPFKGES